MAYNPNKEEIFKTDELALEDGSKVQGKLYSYDKGEKKFKLLFVSENGKYATNKFRGITLKKDLQKVIKMLKSFEAKLA